MKRRFVAAVSVAAMMALGASGASAGEVTGQGVFKDVHGNSPCAYSGQEDLQWIDSTGAPLDTPLKGVINHSQNWGHTKQNGDLTGGANYVPSWHWGCNGHDYGLHP